MSSKKRDDDDACTVNAAQEEVLEDAIANDEQGLEVMLEIIMMIREDDDFARSIYSNCPRLQYLLDKNPDLRPLFEDPKFVGLNFEQVYRNAGGVLPEDQPSFLTRTLKCIVSHPLFRVLKVLLMIKKIYTCILGGGVSFLRSCLCSFFSDDAHEALLDGDGDGRNGFGDDDDRLDTPEQDSNRLALYDAADRMEDPDVQAKMQDILESDPDKLAEAIEADPELRALRDSNPLCAELMKEPETMKILTEPDNLRAFADAPELIERDFGNPDWSPPDVEEGQYNDGYRLGDLEADNEGNGLFDDYEVGENAQEDQGGIFDGYEVGENAQEEQGGIFDDYEAGEIGDEEEGGFLDGYEEGEIENVDDGGLLDEVEVEDDIEAGPKDLDDYDEDGFESELQADETSPRDEAGNNNDVGEDADLEQQDAADRKRNSSKNRRSKKRGEEDYEDDEENAGGGAARGFLGALGAGLVDFVAAETIGVSASAVFGGDEEDELADALNDAEGDLEEQANRVETIADQAAAVAEVATGDEIAGNLEDTLDTVEGAHDMTEPAAESSAQRQEPKPSGSNSQGSSKPQSNLPTGAAAVGAGAGAGIVAVGSRFLSSLNTAAKEYVAANVLGDDIGEALVERLEEGGDEEGGDESDAEDGVDNSNSSRNRPTIAARPEPIEEQDFNGSVEL